MRLDGEERGLVGMIGVGVRWGGGERGGLCGEERWFVGG